MRPQSSFSSGTIFRPGPLMTGLTLYAVCGILLQGHRGRLPTPSTDHMQRGTGASRSEVQREPVSSGEEARKVERRVAQPSDQHPCPCPEAWRSSGEALSLPPTCY